MTWPRSVMLVPLAALLACPAQAGEKPRTAKLVAEVEVRTVSDMIYGEILRQAASKGWRYTPEQIASGYRRHFEELKLRLIDEGYVILAGEAGA